MNNKSQVFQYELNLIGDSLIKEFAIAALNVLPDYFFKVPASSTGKYHPTYALGDGGLVRHTKAAVRIAHSMFGNTTITGKFTPEMKDMIIAALLIHDGLKSGREKQEYTVHDHPIQLVQYIHEKMCVMFPAKFDDIMPRILALIETHMGQWNTGRKADDAVLKLPANGAQAYVHMCDYLASRKLIEINFDAI